MSLRNGEQAMVAVIGGGGGCGGVGGRSDGHGRGRKAMRGFGG